MSLVAPALVGAWLLACTAPPGATAPPVAEAPVVYEGVLRQVDGAELVDRVVTIRARDGRIASVEPSGAAPDPGRFATAGFVDAHCHPAGLGRSLAELDLTGAATYAEVLQRVADAPGEGWLTGRGWDQNDWPDAPAGGWPLAADLDRVTDRPVALRRVDGHALWVDTDALQAASIGPDTPDPKGGRIVRDPSGAAIGVLVDTAMDGVPVPEPPPAELDRQLGEALRTIAAAGLAGVHDMGATDATIARYTALDRAGDLPVRVWVYATPDSQAAARLVARGPWHGDRLHVVGVKLLADGALGSRGALLTHDYADEPGHRGAPIATRDEVADWADRLLGAGAQLAVHAIGDGACHDVVEAFAAARARHPDRADVPLRLEHAQVLAPADRDRLAELGIVASMQPTHATSDMPWAPARLGPERVRWAYRWRDILDAGALLAFGSDFPVEGVEPALGLWAATTRTDPRGKPAGGWQPDQRLSLAEAVHAFTHAAHAAAAAEASPVAPGAPVSLSLWSSAGDRWVAEGVIVR